MSNVKNKATSILLIISLLTVMIGFVNVDKTYAAKKIHLAKTSVSLIKGKTFQQKLINKKGRKIKAKKVKWKSKNSSIAKINKKGKITAVKAGKTKMTAKYKKKTYRFVVRVKDPKEYTQNDINNLNSFLSQARENISFVSSYEDAVKSDNVFVYFDAIDEAKNAYKNTKNSLVKAKQITSKKEAKKVNSKLLKELGYDAMANANHTWDGILAAAIKLADTIINYPASADYQHRLVFSRLICLYAEAIDAQCQSIQSLL